MNTLTLTNCRVEPLGSYLKALGILRLVGEQRDPEARGWWKRDIFFLDCNLSEEELIAFFMGEYRPTPLVAPWNKGGGLNPAGEKTRPSAVAAVSPIAQSTTDRLRAYRESIDKVANLFSTATTPSKEDLVAMCRSVLPDEAVEWLDAVVVLTGEGPDYPPLLGTGGNDGSLELSNNFMQRLSQVLCLGGKIATDASRKWLEAALFEDRPTALVVAPVGQFDPGSRGASASLGSPLDGLVNPWGYVLLVEGALLFAAAAARRLGALGSSKASMPFMSGAATTAGYSSAAPIENPDPKSRYGLKGELWAPVWSRPASYREVASLMGEGRAQWGRRQAQTGLDFARAVATLGVDRGIDRFVRYSFLDRFGRATVAVPTGHLAVRDVPEVWPLSQLDGWLTKVRGGENKPVRGGENKPAAVDNGLKRVERAEMEVAKRGGALRLQEVLVAIADLEEAVGRGERFRKDGSIQPISGLSATRWIENMDDGTPEFRLAAALASQRDDDGSSLRSLLRRVWDPSKKDWTDEAVVSGIGRKPLNFVLAETLCRRAIDVLRRKSTPEDDYTKGLDLAFKDRIPALLTDVVAFLKHEVDSARIQRLLSAFMLLDWRDRVDVDWFTDAPSGASPPAGYCLLAPFFHGRDIYIGDTRVRLRAQPGWPRLLYSGRDVQVFGEAIRRLSFARLDPALAPSKEALSAMAASGPFPRRLAAAMLIPITDAAAASCLKRTVPQPIAVK